MHTVPQEFPRYEYHYTCFRGNKLEARCVQSKKMAAADLVQLIDLSLGAEPRGVVRRGKLNSQFIGTNFSILRAGGRSLVRFQTSKRVRETLGS